MRIPLQRLASLFYNTPLFITPAKAEVISEVLLAHIEARFDRAAIEHKPHEARVLRPSAMIGEPLFTQGSGDQTPFNVYKNVAIIPIDGELVNRGDWIGASSGLVSYDGLKQQFAMARNDSRVKAVVIDANSPGGEAVGMTEVAASLRALAAQKPVSVVANGIAASAMYGIASAAGRRYIGADSLGGSIGTVLMHLEMSRALENRGIKATLIFAGAHKVDGNPFEKLPESVRQDLQSEVNKFYDLFVQTVAAGTGLQEEKIRGTEARLYIGQDAVDTGLFHEVATFDDVLNEAVAEAARPTHVR